MEELIIKYIGEAAVVISIVIAIMTQIVKGLFSALKVTSAWVKTTFGKFVMDIVPIAIGIGIAYLPGVTKAAPSMKWLYGILLGAAAVWVYKFSSKIPGLGKLFKSAKDMGKVTPNDTDGDV